MALFKKKPKEMTELDQSLEAVVAAEGKEKEAKQALEAAESKLQAAYAADLDGEEPSTDEVIRAAAKLKALESLRKDSENVAIAHIAKNQAAHRTRLEEVEPELAEVKRSIDTRTIKLIAEFAKKHGFRVSWPSRQNGGTINLPSLSVDGPALLEIADAVKAVVHRDKDADQLDKLYKERSLMVSLTRIPPPDALQVLLAERRRG